MQALFFRSFGDSSKDEVGLLPKPGTNLPGRVLIKVTAAALNPIDAARRSGNLPSFMVPPFPVIHGLDFCGVVQEKGKIFKKGDIIFGTVNMLEQGVCAEYASIIEENCALKPGNVTDIGAASVAVAAITNLLAFERAGLKADEDNSKKRVLFLGGSGGLGTLAIQMLKNYYHVGFVATTASPGEKSNLCRSLGADMVIDYKEDPEFEKIAATLDQPFDIIIHGYGPANVLAKRQLIRKGGFVVGLGGKDGVMTAEAVRDMSIGAKATLPLLFSFLLNTAFGRMIFDNFMTTAGATRKMFANLDVIYTNALAPEAAPKHFAILANLLASEKIKPVIYKVFSLKDGKAAVELAGKGVAVGKICISID